MEMKMLHKKVLIIESAIEMVSGKLKSIVGRLDNTKLIGHVTSRRQAFIIMDKLIPDFVLVDIYLQGKSGVHILIEIKKKFPAIKVIMVSKYADAHFRKVCQEWGGDYFFDRSCELDLLLKTLKKITINN
jgi:DNA-binding NarL/FixJ family response regulator